MTAALEFSGCPDVISLLSHEHGQDPSKWTLALTEFLAPDETIAAVEIPSGQGAKAHGMTRSIRLTISVPGGDRDIYAKAPAEEIYAENLPSDRAREIYWRVFGYSKLPNHAQLKGVGFVGTDGAICSRGTAEDELILLEYAVSGTPYNSLLDDFARESVPSQVRKGAELLARHLVDIHSVRPTGPDEAMYKRFLRDGLLIPSLRLIDGNPDRWGGWPSRCLGVKTLFMEWSDYLSRRSSRLRRIHLDFHPWNIFLDGSTVNTIGARSPGYGDPADDLSCILVNYLVFGMFRLGRFTGAYRTAFEHLREVYLGLTNDTEMHQVVNPFFAKRLLVFLSPSYYPGISIAMAETLLDLAERMLKRQIDPLYGLFE